MSACTATGLEVKPTQTSPLRMNRSPDMAQPMLRSKRFDGFRGSTTTVPLIRVRLIGRRTIRRVVYGASGVRTTALLPAPQS